MSAPTDRGLKPPPPPATPEQFAQLLARARRPDLAALLVRRLGFVREGYSRRYLKIGGRWRDHERWAVVKDEWKGVSPI